MNIIYEKIGPKAHSIIKLNEIGINTPPCFFINTDRYFQHIRENGIDRTIETFLKKRAGLTPKQKRNSLRRIREKIISSDLNPEFSRYVLSELKRLNSRSLAVRSSSTLEDLEGKSFAGLYESFLDLHKTDEVLAAIKKCWASFWNERASSYREQNQLNEESAGMAVIVQQFIPADAAGVVFTSDPVTGSVSRIILEAVIGTGDRLVGGEMEPGRYIIDKKNLKIIKCEVPESQVEPGRVLYKRSIRRLAKIAKKIERKWGAPVDIEWAIKHGRIYILQCRKITAIRKKKEWEDYQIWSNLNAGEILPDIVTPFTWSIAYKLFANIFEPVYREIGLSIERAPLAGVICGRVYFNLNTLAGLLKSFPFSRWVDVDQLLGGHQNLKGSYSIADIPDEYLPKAKIGWMKLIYMSLRMSVWGRVHSLRRGEKHHIWINRKIKEMRMIDLTKLNEQDIYEFHLKIIDFLYGEESVPPSIAYPSVGMMYFHLLDRFCRRRKSIRDKNATGRLLWGIGGMESAEAGHELWKLADVINDNKKLKNQVLRAETFDELENNLKESPEGNDFLGRWHEFMNRHGHHTRGEIEWYNKRWSEEPDYILTIVKSYLRSSSGIDPVEDYRRRSTEREQYTREIRRSIKNPVSRLRFNYLLQKSSKGMLIRENMKSDAVKLISLSRKTMIEIGSRLQKRGLLDEPEDLFFLDLEEIGKVWFGEMDYSNISATINSRKNEWNEYHKISPPSIIKGKYIPQECVQQEAVELTDTLRGLAVSGGIATGRARVLLRSDEEMTIEQREILVAPFTDPGWTPYFVPAAGIVMDMGGLLSHGSIIAREYGIPAVVNVGDATKIIRTGQIVTVDGNNGIVRIMKE